MRINDLRILIATIKEWNIENARCFREQYGNFHDIRIITKKEDLTIESVAEFHPALIFFPHWSHIIPKEIYETYNCVVFHMTDLPYGRGGSPLQNLIVRGHKETKLSAIKVTEGIDQGPIYFKEELALCGSAEEIYKRASDIIFTKMIPKFLVGNIEPKEQEGNPVVFKRRKKEESELKQDFSLEKIYDYIRMLDAEGYPHAYIEFGDYKIEFVEGKMRDGFVEARAIVRKEI